jgi:MinD-like ATPase involved in chromosome partitioning or flagellar assembly
MTSAPGSRTEIIVFCSGKGGTGKTSLISALGYALGRSGHNVLLVDADRATDGLSLFMLGPEGMSQLESFAQESTFTGLLAAFDRTGVVAPAPHRVDRLGTQDHELSYEVLISDRYIYGDAPDTVRPTGSAIDHQVERGAFQRFVQGLFGAIRQSGRFDYVLVDSRGGFSFESTDVAAAGDSFIVVTEATYTNFYQDRNLVDRISVAARQMQTQSVLRAIIVNKSTEPPEAPFRNELCREFGVRFEDTFAVSLDVEALRAYKMQRAVYREAPASRFAYDSLQAFQRILRIVTSQWPVERVERWNALVGSVDAAIAKHNAQVEAQALAEKTRQEHFAHAEAELSELRAELERERAARAQEQKRQDLVLAELREQENRRTREVGELQSRIERESAAVSETRVLGVQHASELQIRELSTANRALKVVLAALLGAVVLAGVGAWMIQRPAAAPAPAPTGALPSSGAYPPDAAALQQQIDDLHRTIDARSGKADVQAVPPQPQQQRADYPAPAAVPASGTSGGAAPVAAWFKPCAAGTNNIVVAGGFVDPNAAAAVLERLETRNSGFAFKVVDTLAADDGKSRPDLSIFAGSGLSAAEAAELLARLRKAGVAPQARITMQKWDCGKVHGFTAAPAEAKARSKGQETQAGTY